MLSQLDSPRLRSLPEALRRTIIEARAGRAWSQTELGKRLGLPQAHISGIETGKIVPRYDTLLDLVRVLDHDLVLVPKALVPAVQSLIRSHGADGEEGEQPLYAIEEDGRDAS